MPKRILNYILLFFALVIVQVIIFNNLILFNCALALVFLYYIIILPVSLTTNQVMTLSFLLGFSIDIFQDTPGLNAMACTLIGFMRRPIFYLYNPRDEEFGTKKLGLNTLGVVPFLKYLLTIVILYTIILFTIEAVSYFDVNRLLLRIGGTSAFTFIIILALDSLTLKHSEKRS